MRPPLMATPVGAVRAGFAILTVSTAVLAGGTIMLPRALDPWRHAAAHLPLGRNEKLFLEITGDSPFVPETRVLGNPRDRRTGVYYIPPFGWPFGKARSSDRNSPSQDAFSGRWT
jgi:monoamine oxidase